MIWIVHRFPFYSLLSWRRSSHSLAELLASGSFSTVEDPSIFLHSVLHCSRQSEAELDCRLAELGSKLRVRGMVEYAYLKEHHPTAILGTSLTEALGPDRTGKVTTA